MSIARLSDSENSYLSTPEAARALDVSVSTIKRWVDDGVLPAHKTLGGHRKLLRAEVLALTRQKDLPRGDLFPLSVPPKSKGVPDAKALANSVFDALMRGDGELARASILGAYRQGFAVEVLADQVIAPAMNQVGAEWENGCIDVWHEHRATHLCAAALFELKEKLQQRAEKNRPIALGGAPEGNHSTLASLLAEMVLIDNGWRVVNLGANTPMESFSGAIAELRPRLLWISVTHLDDPGRFEREYRQMYQAAEQANVAVAIGGRALDGPLRRAMSYSTYGDGLGNLAAFARTLHPRSRKPRRGRPPR